MDPITGKLEVVVNSEEVVVRYFQGDDARPRFERRWERTMTGARCTSKGDVLSALKKTRCKRPHENLDDMSDLADEIEIIEHAATSLMGQMDQRENS